jgi:tetratricopeptide (TPR) repeat protein
VVAGGIIAGIQISKRAQERHQALEEKTELARLNLLWTDIISAKIEFYRGSGDLDRMRQRLQGTLDELTRFIKRNPNVAQGWYARARGKMYFHNYEEAEQDLTEALKIAPDFGPAWMLLAQVYLEQSAQKTVGFQTTKEQREKEIQILLEKAEAALRRVKEEDLQKLGLRKTPEDEVNEVLLRALRSYYIQKDYKHAKEILRDALKKTESEEFYNWLGFWAGHSKEAIQYQDQAIKIMPHYAKAYFDRGRTKLILRDYAGAIEDYNQVVKINPDNFGAYCNRGAAKSNMQNYQGAFEDFSQAIKLKPDLPELYNLRAQAKEGLKDLASAIEDYNQSIRLNPTDGETYYRRGFIHSELEDWPRAIADWEKATQLSPTYKGLLEGIMRQAKEKMKPKEPR